MRFQVLIDQRTAGEPPGFHCVVDLRNGRFLDLKGGLRKNGDGQQKKSEGADHDPG